MAETNATTAGSPSTFGVQKLSMAIMRGDVAFALGVIAIMTVLIFPMPKWLLDISLALSLSISVLILFTALFIEKPLEFSSFPTILLITTMLRLSLNVASTRLILSNGHEGLSAAGEVIRAFGSFIMQNNFVIGIIVFAILVLVNFVVITKGSGRIAEVSARFSLDAMPGKQMAIDADLSSGLINEDEARKRRRELENESNFYGAMDGSAKFVRGDAVAGLCITFINIIGGIIIGVVQNGMGLADATHTYTVLTVGDGLISQIPALIVSTAAGILVSKAGVEGSADKALFNQLSAYPNALGLSSFLMVVLALLPGIPMIPFMLLAGVTGSAAWKLTESKAKKKAQDVIEQASKDAQENAESSEIDPLKEAMHIDQIRVELGYGILPIVNGEQGQKLTDQIKILRKQLAREVGFVLPTVRIQDNLELNNYRYSIKVKEIEVASGELRPHMLLCMDPEGKLINLPGEPTIEPTFQLKAMWITHSHKPDAEKLGYTVVDPLTVIITHLSEVIKDNTSDLLSFVETQKLLEDMEKTHQKLIKDLIPAQVSMATLQRILQKLLNERVSIRDLPTILEAIAEISNFTKSITQITEHVRKRMARQLCALNSDEEGVLPLVTLSPEWEGIVTQALVGEGENQYLSLPPSRLQEFTMKITQIYDQQAAVGISPVLLVGAVSRAHVRALVERFRSSIVVMSHNEIHPKARIRTVATLS